MIHYLDMVFIIFHIGFVIINIINNDYYIASLFFKYNFSYQTICLNSTIYMFNTIITLYFNRYKNDIIIIYFISIIIYNQFKNI